MKGYKWALHEVCGYSPYFTTSDSIMYLVERVNLLTDIRDAECISLVACRAKERACHGCEGYSLDFFYVYLTLFRDLGVRIHFSEFQMGVLWALNFFPTQLHPNGWTFMQAFCVLCTTLLLTSTPASFLYFFHALPHPNKSWISVVPVKDKQLFTLFNTSYKDFKTNFFKVAIRDPGRTKFYFDDGQPKFPFYWTKNIKKVIS